MTRGRRASAGDVLRLPDRELADQMVTGYPTEGDASVWIVELKLEPTDEWLAARPAHREKLAELHRAGIVRMAGPLADDSGAVVIVDVDSRAAVDDLLAGDAYYATSGVAIADVREWRPFIT